MPAFERLLSALYYSLLVYLPLALVAAICGADKEGIEDIYRAENGFWPPLGVALASGVALPALIAYAGAKWSDSTIRTNALRALDLKPSHRTPSAWDHFFGIELPAYVRVTTKSGSIIGGYLGELSFTGYGRQERARDIYLEEQWELDDKNYGFVKPVDWSMGVWVDGSDILSVELVAVNEEEANAFKEARESGTSN